MCAAQLPGIIRHLGLAVAARSSDAVSDSELLERFFRDRDKAAFELLVWRHSKMVLGTCRRLLRDVHEAEDAFQACFLTLVRRGGSIGRRESVGGWLHKVAYRLALGLNARRARKYDAERSLWERLEPVLAADPSVEAAWREVRGVLDEEVNRLPDIYRVPFVLCCLEGRSNADVAGELGCAVGTVESRLSRARQRLRAGLARRGVTTSAGLVAALSGSDAASAFVPATLASCTAKAATQVLGGELVAAGMLSAPVAAMTEGVLRAMWMTKVKTAAAIVLAVSLAGTGTGVLAYRPGAADQTAATENSPKVAADQIDRLIEQLSSDNFADREKARKELDRIGAPALDALRRAARNGDAEQKTRAADLVKTIEARVDTANLLAPKRLRLVYNDTPLAEAVADFRRRSGYDIVLSDPEGKLKNRTVTLDTGEVTFWRALAEFCQRAGVVEVSPTARLPGIAPPLGGGVGGVGIGGGIGGFAGGGIGGIGGFNGIGGGIGGLNGIGGGIGGIGGINGLGGGIGGIAGGISGGIGGGKPGFGGGGAGGMAGVQGITGGIGGGIQGVGGGGVGGIGGGIQGIGGGIGGIAGGIQGIGGIGGNQGIAGGGFGGGFAMGAGVAPVPAPGRITLTDGKPKNLPTDDRTAIRVRAIDKPNDSGSPSRGEIVLTLEANPEPRLRWHRTVGVSLRTAIDDQGQALEHVRPAADVLRGVQLPPVGAGVGAGAATLVGTVVPAGGGPINIRLKKGVVPATSVREISGTITAVLFKAATPCVIVEDVASAAGKANQGLDGSSIRVLDVTRDPNGGQVRIRFTIEPPANSAPAGGLSWLSTAQGRVMLRGSDDSGPDHELTLLDEKGNQLSPLGAGVRTGVGRDTEYTLTYRPGDHDARIKLVYTTSQSVTLDVPFKLTNVPVP